MQRALLVCAAVNLIVFSFSIRGHAATLSEAAPSPPLSQEMEQAAMGAAMPKLPNYGLRSGCNVSVTHLPVELRELLPPFVAKIRDIHEYYMSSPQEGPGLNDRIRARNKAVRSEFKLFEDRRSADYSRYRCAMFVYKSCTSSKGNTKVCQESMSAGSYRSFLRDSLAFTPKKGNGLIRGPTLSTNAQSVTFTMRKSGKGKLGVRVTATAQVRPTDTPRLVAGEKLPIRVALKAVNLPDDEAIDP